MDRTTKFKVLLTGAFRLLLVVTAGLAAFAGDGLHLVFLLFTLFLTFLPDILQRRLQITYPSEFEIMILLLIIASMYLGEMHDFYEKHFWWDILLHGIFSVIIGGFGFSLVFILNRAEKVALNLSPKFVAFFAFCFAVTVGALWEIFEFGMDQAFGLNMQKSGLMDTMGDLIIDVIGATIFPLFGILHMNKDFRPFERLEKKFLKLNPDLHQGDV